MNLRPKRDEPHDINLTPLIDVVFLLLIFFMVSTTFDRSSELTIDLPKASSEAKAEHDKPIDVAIDAQGQFFINGRSLVNTQLETVREALRRAAAGRDSPPIIVNADQRTPMQATITPNTKALNSPL